MSAAARAAQLPLRYSCAVSSSPNPGCISICSRGRLPPNQGDRKAVNVRWRARSMLYWPRTMAEPMPAFDPRLTPWRGGTAANHLEGKGNATRFVEGRIMEGIAPQAPLRPEPRAKPAPATRGLKGERAMVSHHPAPGLAVGPP